MLIDSNLTGIRQLADMIETNVNKAKKITRQSGQDMVFWRCPTQNQIYMKNFFTLVFHTPFSKCLC